MVILLDDTAADSRDSTKTKRTRFSLNKFLWIFLNEQFDFRTVILSYGFTRIRSRTYYMHLYIGTKWYLHGIITDRFAFPFEKPVGTYNYALLPPPTPGSNNV